MRRTSSWCRAITRSPWCGSRRGRRGQVIPSSPSRRTRPRHSTIRTSGSSTSRATASTVAAPRARWSSWRSLTTPGRPSWTTPLKSITATGTGTGRSSARRSSACGTRCPWVSPRKAAANIQYASIASSMVGDDNAALDPTRPWTIDANTGRFAGPPPPTGAGQFAATFAPLVPQLLPALDLAMTVDSVLPRTAGDFPCGALVNTQDICYEFFVSYTRGTTKASFRTLVGWPIWEGFAANTPIDAAATYEAQLGAFPVVADSASSARFGVPNGFSKFNAAVGASLTRYIRYSAMEGQMGRRLLGQISPGGSRWFTGADETVDHPTYSVRAGHIPGVDSIYAPLSHLDVDPTTPGVQNYSPDFADAGGNTIRTTMQCFPYVVAALSRQADIEVTWGPGWTIASGRH